MLMYQKRVHIKHVFAKGVKSTYLAHTYIRKKMRVTKTD